MLDLERAGREASPEGGVLDSQTVKAPAAKARGFDGGKRMVGRKRHVVVDTDGRLLMVNLTTADISDSAGAQMILSALRKRWPWLTHLFADGAYNRAQLMDKAAFLDIIVEIVRKMEDQKGFEILPRRWVVEPTVRRREPAAFLTAPSTAFALGIKVYLSKTCGGVEPPLRPC